MTLNHFVAQCGITSRRKAVELIREGRVMVNGEMEMNPARRITDEDEINVDGEVVSLPRPGYFILNKPKGLITTMADERGRKSVKHLFPPQPPGLKPVGRLDKDSSGLLLVTNDGDFAALMSHPRHGIEKEYRVEVVGIPDDKDLGRMRKGITIDGRRTSPCKIEVIYQDPQEKHTILAFFLHEGRNRQIRKMTEAVGHPTKELTRVRIGHLRLKGMQPGECRRLSQSDLEKLRALASPPKAR